MKFEKRRLAEADMGYAVSTLNILGEDRVIVASEGTGPAVVFDGPEMKPWDLATAPGGTMGFAEAPGGGDALFVITGFYPIFKAESAGVHLFRAANGLDQPWSGERIIDLPFVHRIASVSSVDGNYLVGATVCGGKDFQDDWSRPGAVYVYAVGDVCQVGEPRIILDSLHRNHGLALGAHRGVDSLLIAADEGVFSFTLPGSLGPEGDVLESWAVSTLLDHPVSEIELCDLDGDGVDELITIEPFHGEELAIYRDSGEAWEKVYSAELAFGHGLSAGMLAGSPRIVVGNRAGAKDLVCFSVESAGSFTMVRDVVDEGTGTAGTAILETGEGAIVASNPEFSEYALYTVAGKGHAELLEE